MIANAMKIILYFLSYLLRNIFIMLILLHIYQHYHSFLIRINPGYELLLLKFTFTEFFMFSLVVNIILDFIFGSFYQTISSILVITSSEFRLIFAIVQIFLLMKSYKFIKNSFNDIIH